MILFLFIYIVYLIQSNNLELFSNNNNINNKKCITLQYVIINSHTSFWNKKDINEIHNIVSNILSDLVSCRKLITYLNLRQSLVNLIECRSNTIDIDNLRPKNSNIIILLKNNIYHTTGCYFNQGIIILGWNKEKYNEFNLPHKNKLRAETLVHEILHSGKLQHIHCDMDNHNKYHNNLMFVGNTICNRDRYRTILNNKQKQHFIKNCKWAYPCNNSL